MEEGGSRTDEPSGEIGNFVGAGQATPGRAGGDPSLHVGGEVGPAEVGGHDHLEAGDDRAGGVAAPLVEDPPEGADPSPGSEVSPRTMVGERGKEDKEDASGSEAGTKMVDEPGDSVERGENLQGIVRGRVGAAEGGMGKEGKACEGAGLQGAVDCVKLRDVVSRGGVGCEVPKKRGGVGKGGEGRSV